MQDMIVFGGGRYLLKVNHVWSLSRETGEMLVMPAFQGSIAAPGEER
jgi:hypothetical protein